MPCLCFLQYYVNLCNLLLELSLSYVTSVLPALFRGFSLCNLLLCIKFGKLAKNNR